MSAPGRKWDESRSPQWKYLLQKESTQRRMTRKEIERERRQTALENTTEEKPKHTHSTKRKDTRQKRGKKIKKYIRMGGIMREVTKENIELFQGMKDDSK